MKIDEIQISGRLRQDLGDIDQLAASIQAIGLVQPVIVDERSRLIAGRRRLEAAKSLGWHEIPHVLLETDDRLRAEIDENVHRLDFSPSEAVAVARALQERERKAAEKRQKAGRPSSKLDGGRVDDRIGKAVGMGRSTLRKAVETVEAAEVDPEKADLVRRMDEIGNVDKVHKELRHRRLKERYRESARPLPDAIDLRVGDMRELGGDIEDASIDAVICDPPYLVENVGLYSALGQLAARVLKPGAPLVSYTGHLVFLKTAQALEAAGLRFVSTLSVQLQGQHKLIRCANLLAFDTPCLFFSRGIYRPRGTLPTLITNDRQEKILHPWQQGCSAFEFLIERLTKPGELVLDPFAGSGTVLVAAARLGRRALGFEIDEKTAAVAEGRIAGETAHDR